MATLEEVLATISDADYLHDIQFIIDEDLRTITVPSKGVVLGVVGDKNINRINFMMPKKYNGFDMSSLEARINYTNAKNEDHYYVVNDITVEEDNVLFSWLVDEDATAAVGEVEFVVTMLNVVDNEVMNSFSTTKAKAKVLEGINVEYSDISNVVTLRKNYSPNGDMWVDTAHIDFDSGEYIEVKISSIGSGTNENLLSISSGSYISSFYNDGNSLHLYSTKDGNTYKLAVDMCGDEQLVQDDIVVTCPLTVKVNKDGVYINNVIYAPTENSELYNELFEALIANSTFLVGSMEGANKSKSTYEYIKVFN